ncbi:ANF_receptor domain-containing protein [Caerostris extrusa]|uniref:ANF_receptor domain-containing protein n=1 Tax=Caerostris extrusa TaxID=172846 RepID=A0AAV4XMU7_CAEEX|nr:ANF_receptor domain-containing protein [Caerostris extrusa]
MLPDTEMAIMILHIESGFICKKQYDASPASMIAFETIEMRCSDSKVSNKEKYTTFARTLPPSSKVCKSLISLLKYFKWERLMLLVANDTSNMQIAEALSDLAQQHNIDIVETFFLPGDYLTKDNTTLKNIVLQTYTRTRGTLLAFLIFYCPVFRLEELL